MNDELFSDTNSDINNISDEIEKELNSNIKN